MAWSKAKTMVVVGVGVLLAAGTAIVISELKARAAREEDFVAYEIQHQSLLQKLFRQKVDENKLRHQMVGVWEMAANKFRGDTDYTYYQNDNHRLKIWTLTNWSIVTYDSDSNIVYSASGPYDLHGNLYTETIESATGVMTKYIGAQPRFKIRVDGDKYYQMGMGKKPGLEEVWQRLPQ